MKRGAPSAPAVVALLAVALGSGCAGGLTGQGRTPPISYVLAPGLPAVEGAVRPSRGSGPTLLVSPVASAAGFDTRRMAYLERDFQLDYFADHAWVDTPAAMLGPLLVDALASGSAFGAVTQDALGVTADVRLDVRVESFYQDFRTRPSTVRIALRTTLVAPRERRILATETFSDSEPAPSDDPSGGAVAANRALGRLLPRIAAFAAADASALHAARSIGGD